MPIRSDQDGPWWGAGDGWWVVAGSFAVLLRHSSAHSSTHKHVSGVLIRVDASSAWSYEPYFLQAGQAIVRENVGK